jgi:hypothetical protein
VCDEVYVEGPYWPFAPNPSGWHDATLHCAILGTQGKPIGSGPRQRPADISASTHTAPLRSGQVLQFLQVGATAGGEGLFATLRHECARYSLATYAARSVDVSGKRGCWCMVIMIGWWWCDEVMVIMMRRRRRVMVKMVMMCWTQCCGE